MMTVDRAELDLLHQALAQAKRLLDELVQRRDELEKNSSDLPLENLETGRQAINKAVAAAHRAYAALADAWRIATGEEDGKPA